MANGTAYAARPARRTKMLGLTKDRLDYGEQLRAPVGYRLDLGVATTYSLDLEALVAASLALNLNHTLEGTHENGPAEGERLALLESVDRLQGKLLIFYQRGNVKTPEKFNRLFTLLEPLLVPAASVEGSQGPFASFHPKVWLLRFAPEDRRKPVRFRLLVLSRNLSFDRSWDIAVAIDGEASKHGGNTDARLVDFLRALAPDGTHAAHIDALCQSLSNVQWQEPDGFGQLEVLPGRAEDDHTAGSSPIKLDGPIDELLVLSPFVDADPNSLLQELSRRTRGVKTLISRADTLDAIGPGPLAGWDVRSLSEIIIDGEERADETHPRTQDIHAKLVVARVGIKTIWHVGSANMTNAAFGSPSRSLLPRNRELMLRMVGSNSKLGPSRLLEQWNGSGAFVTHVFRTSATAAAEPDTTLRRVVYALTSLPWCLHAKQTADDLFSVDLTLPQLPSLPVGYSVAVGLLCHPSRKPLAKVLTWNEVKLADLSAFVAIEVSVASTKTSQRFSVQAAFEVDLMEARKRAVFKELAGSEEKILRYLNLLLDAEASKAKWLRADGDDTDTDMFGLDTQGALYEQLLRAASRSPDRIRRALDVFARLRAAEVDLPDGLEETLHGFASFAEVIDAA